jgi:uncharacterized protein YhaN
VRIERIELDGFGRFHDERWEMPEGLTVLRGANEAGKTTLLNAVRALLFGFPATRDGRVAYPALSGGRRGGRLVVSTAASEQWTIERHGEKGGAGALAVRAPNGNQGGQETLDRLMHGADRDLFNNIFAFGLDELQSFGSLSSDGVSARIYGAGSGLGGMSALDLERRLRSEQEASFRPRGRDQTLNALLNRSDALQHEISDLARQPAEYDQAHRELATLRDRASEIRAGVRTWTEREARTRALLAAQPVIAELELVEAELAAGDASLDELSVDAAAVLERRVAELDEARHSMAGVAEELSATRLELERLVVDDRLTALADEVAALRDARLAAEHRAERLREAEAAASVQAAGVAEQLTRVGGWDEPRLLGLDDSISSVEATRRAERELDERRRTLDAAEGRLRAVTDELRRRSPADAPESEDSLADRANALGELDRLRRRPARPSPPPPISGMLLIGCVAIGLVAGVWLAAPLVGLGLGVIVGLVLAGWGWWRRSANPAHDRVAGELLARARFEREPTDAELDVALREVTVAQARHELRREQRADDTARTSAALTLEHERDAADAELAAAAGRWAAWLQKSRLPPDATPEVARAILTSAGIARRAARERDGHRLRVAEIRAEENAFATRVDDVLRRAGRGSSSAGDLAGALALLIADADRNDAAARRSAELRAALARLEDRCGALTARVEERAAALESHLAAGGADSPEALQARLARARGRQALRESHRQLVAQLGGVAGSTEAVDELRVAALAAGPARLEAERTDAAGQLARLAEEQDAALSGIGALEARIAQLEAAEELGARRQELAVVRGQAVAAAREWAVRAVALRLLEETRRRYERERQPDVVRDAERHFARITDERYAHILAPPGAQAVQVETESGEVKRTEELSRGTAEQLYLALRFGLIEQFARHAEALPVVMDDILVNFDADRGERAARAISGLAERHQVLYFTCHEWTARLLDPAGERTLDLG